MYKLPSSMSALSIHKNSTYSGIRVNSKLLGEKNHLLSSLYKWDLSPAVQKLKREALNAGLRKTGTEIKQSPRCQISLDKVKKILSPVKLPKLPN